MRTVRRVAVLLLGVSAGALPGPHAAHAQEGALVRDSAGVRIVENRAPAWAAGEEWRLSREPVFVVGRGDGSGVDLFNALWSGRLSTGEIVILNAGSHEVLVVDPVDGSVTRFGREGEGPADFLSPSRGLILPGDTIVIQDREWLKLFTPDGEFARWFRVVGGRIFPRPTLRGRLGGRLMFSDGYATGRSIRQTQDGGLIVESRLGPDLGSYAWVSYDLEGEFVDSLITTRGSERFTVKRRDGGIAQDIPPFGRSQYTSVGGGFLVTGWNESFQVDWYDVRGNLFQRARIEFEPERVTEAQRRAFHLRYAADVSPARRRQLEEEFELLPQYDTKPAFGSIHVDVVGNTWVQSYQLPSHDPGLDLEWMVLDRSGRLLGRVEPRPALRVDEIGTDYILGRATDELGVELIVLYGLDRIEGD